MGACNSVLPSRNAPITREQRVEYLKATPFFMYLDSDDMLVQMADCFDQVVHVDQGEKFNAPDNDTFIVASGAMELSTNVPSSERKSLFTKGFLCNKCPGDIINKGGVEENAKRRVTQAKLRDLVDDLALYAKEASVLLRCNDVKFEQFLVKHSALRKDLEHITKCDISECLTPLPFLKDIQESQRTVLAAMCRYEAIDHDAIIFNQGDPGEKFYMLLNGEVSVLRKLEEEEDHAGIPRTVTKNGEPFSELTSVKMPKNDSDSLSTESSSSSQPTSVSHTMVDGLVYLASLGPGDYFGETAVMARIPRTTTVKSAKKSLFLTVDNVAFQNFVAVCPDVGEKIQASMKARMIDKLMSMDVPFFKGIKEEMFKELATSAVMHDFDASDTVFKEGDMGDRFYIIIHGEVTVETTDTSAGDEGEGEGGQESAAAQSNDEGDRKSNTKQLGVLGPGKYFGEMALVQQCERTASVICKTHAILMSIEASVFHKLFDNNPEALIEFKLRCLGEKAELKYILTHTNGLAMFETFLKTELADENIMFWRYVNNFKNNPTKQLAIEIYNNFVSESAPTQVNIPGKLRSSLTETIKGLESDAAESELSAELFKASQAEIYKLMVRDNFARFRRTDDFKEFFKRLGILL